MNNGYGLNDDMVVVKRKRRTDWNRIGIWGGLTILGLSIERLIGYISNNNSPMDILLILPILYIIGYYIRKKINVAKINRTRRDYIREERIINGLKIGEWIVLACGLLAAGLIYYYTRQNFDIIWESCFVVMYTLILGIDYALYYFEDK